MTWFNGKTDRLAIVEGHEDDGSHRMTPFAQGYLDAFQLGSWDNPFNGDEQEWWSDYALGFDFGKTKRQEKADKYNNLFGE